MNLDDKLYELLSRAVSGRTSSHEIVAQIKQVFTDAHYYNLEGKQYLKDGTILPLYSGEEWYNRFKAELDSILNKYSALDAEDYIEAAERAAGLSEDSK